MIASNTTTGKLYASMQQLDPEAGSFVGYGVAVIDSATNTVSSVIAPPTDGQGNAQIFYFLAVDETANKVYAAPAFGTTLYVIDGASGAFTTPITLSGTSPSIFAMAVDGPGQRLYTLQPGPNGVNTVVVGVIDTTSGATITTIPLTDLNQGTSGLAVDTTNHLLFACGYASPSTNQSTAVDTIDTTTNAVTGTQKTFDPATSGYFVGCNGGPGYATLVTNGTTGYHALEPKDIDLPKGFVPDSYSVLADGLTVWVFGHDTSSGNALAVGLAFSDPTLEHINFQKTGAMGGFDALGRIFTAQPVGGSGTDFWAAFRIPDDGGDSIQSAVLRLHTSP